MKTSTAREAHYQIEGEFLGFLPDSDGKLKHIQVQVGERILPIKLAKELRETLGQKLIEGDRLLVSLSPISKAKAGQLKLKSDRVTIVNSQDQHLVLESSAKSKKNKQGKMLLCRKSSCAKRGGKRLYNALIETLNKLGLQDVVTIELTGCQKQCKKAPSLILMPGKVKHAYVNPQELTSLVEAHYL
ncbi:MAG: (2Fe-2S) ferredoxin domain-containing protein [Pleurocapsa sp.]